MNCYALCKIGSHWRILSSKRKIQSISNMLYQRVHLASILKMTVGLKNKHIRGSENNSSVR